VQTELIELARQDCLVNHRAHGGGLVGQEFVIVKREDHMIGGPGGKSLEGEGQNSIGGGVENDAETGVKAASAGVAHVPSETAPKTRSARPEAMGADVRIVYSPGAIAPAQNSR